MSECVTAVYFQLLTGCRPSEAAYITLTKKSFRRNTYPDFEGDWVAFMPKSETKTSLDYKWDIPQSANTAVKLLRALHEIEPALQENLMGQYKFKKSLDNWFASRVLKDAVAE